MYGCLVAETYQISMHFCSDEREEKTVDFDSRP